MKGTRNLIILIIVGVVLIFGVWGCNSYNGLMSSEVAVSKSWGNVETNYQRRMDLYNSVIKAIEGSANFEKSTLREVLEARSRATSVNVDINDPESLAKFQAAQGSMQSAFGRLLAVVENYPDLKTTQAFRDFQTQIEGTENRINVARQDYNAKVENFNLRIVRFPSNMIAGLAGKKEKAFYKSDAGSEKAPEIKFDIK
ncbi:MAG: LemA family protein [Terrimonas sp.]|nr:LemA family protein [Terrimonas sp.]